MKDKELREILEKTKKHLLNKAMRYAEESIKEEYSHKRKEVFDFEWFKSNMQSELNADLTTEFLALCKRPMVSEDEIFNVLQKAPKDGYSYDREIAKAIAKLGIPREYNEDEKIHLEVLHKMWMHSSQEWEEKALKFALDRLEQKEV